MDTLYDETKFIMKKYNITANKSLGQNFLIDDEVVSQIIKQASITKDDVIIEIGPGLGTLTKPLLENANKVICIELDSKMINILNDRFSLYKNFELINDDVLKVNLNKIIEENKDKKVKVVANLPYYITTPIIMKLLEDGLKIESITVMVQKEVAKRLTAKTGQPSSGAITYAIEYYSIAKSLIEVPKQAFIPNPEVDSTVIQLQILDEPKIKVKDEEMLFKIIKTSFMQRRKTLINSLVNGNVISKEKIEKILNELNIDLKIRGEKLTLEQFGDILAHM